MNAATIRRLLRLYPRNWRDRYEEEFVALLEQQPATLGACADVAFGAVVAHWRAIRGGKFGGAASFAAPGRYCATEWLRVSPKNFSKVLIPCGLFGRGLVNLCKQRA